MKLKQFRINADKKRLKELINEVTKDIILFGHKEPVVLFIKNGLIEDYEIAKEITILFKEEEQEITTLENWLMLLISAHDHTKFGAYLKTNRLASKLTQKELAKKIGVDVRLVQRWEADDVFPDGKNIFKIIRTLSLDPEIVELFIK